MSIVVLVAVGTIAIFTSSFTTNAFRHYVENDIERNRGMINDLLTSYKGDRSPENLQILVGNISSTSGERLIVVDSTGKVLADSGQSMVGQQLDWPDQLSRSFFDRRGAILVGPGANVTDTVQVPITGVVRFPITSEVDLPQALATARLKARFSYPSRRCLRTASGKVGLLWRGCRTTREGLVGVIFSDR